MITGRDLTIEIGGRTLLARRVVHGRARRQGGPGRSQRDGQVVAGIGHLRPGAPSPARGRQRRGSGDAWFPPAGARRRGSGARAHRVLPRPVGPGPRRPRRGAARGPRARWRQIPTAEAIATFTDLEERYRAAGGYNLEGEIARLAEGIGLRQDALFDDIDSLSGGQRRRVDIVRVLFGRPDTLVLDEPTNHLDLAAKRWLMAELSRFPGRCSSSATISSCSTGSSPRC